MYTEQNPRLRSQSLKTDMRKNIIIRTFLFALFREGRQAALVFEVPNLYLLVLLT